MEEEQHDLNEQCIREEIEEEIKELLETHDILKHVGYHQGSIRGKFFKTIKGDVTLPNSFLITNIILTPKPDRDSPEKENHRLIFLKNTEAKISNKILANRMQKHIRWIVYLDQVESILGMQRWFNVCKSINVIYHIKKLKNKNHIIVSIDAEKPFYKIQHHFMQKMQIKTAIGGTIQNIIKAIHEKPNASIILNGERLEAFLLRSTPDKDVRHHHCYLT